MIVLGIAATTRFLVLGEESFWYDEVVTMRVARSPSVSALLRTLGQIDATRAPLHPILLHGWIAAFGPSEFTARAFSVACGLLTVLVVFGIARDLGGETSGYAAAYLAACSPLLIQYDREARMYALLTLLTVLAWRSLLAFRRGASCWRAAQHAGLLLALSYTHPLGVLMVATLLLGALADWRAGGWTVRRLAIVHGAWLIGVAPWIGRYLDHPPEFVTGRLPLRFLLGVPIGFLGGDSRTLVALGALIGAGLWPGAIPGLTVRRGRGAPWPVAAWMVVPPTALYAYSRIGHPIFGPSRYSVFVAPAFCILVGVGLGRLRPLARGVVVVPLVVLAFIGGERYLHSHQRKAPWREAAALLDEEWPGVPVVVIPPGPGRNFEVEVARYYLGDRREVVPITGRTVDEALSAFDPEPQSLIFSASLRDGSPMGDVPDELNVDGPTVHHLNLGQSGLRLIFVRGVRGR